MPLQFPLTALKKSDTTDVKPQDNKQNTQNQQNTQQQNTQNQNTQKTASASSFAVKEVSKDIKKNEMVDFKWDENGKEMKLSDYKGKVILLNFWATWCPPCRKELPDLSTISTELKDKDFKMIGVSVDDNQEVLNNFLKSNNLPYTIVFEPNELVGKYMTAAGQNQNVVPQTYIIDKNGKVVEAIMGSRSKADFLSIINKYL
ncbi:MAG: thiol-disulfide isomerase-like protein [Chlorobi bacterium OLB5]|nr:MAG: thiol-disulfide isomerase-like protein [Chlorobi bacterium OLB5]